MAYQTGTASSYSNLQSIIETFLTGTPGYTLTSGILTKAGTSIHVAFTTAADSLRLEMGKSSSAGSLLYKHHTLTGRAQLVGIGDGFYIDTLNPVFPINYYLFYFSSPVEMFRCVIEYNNGYTQNIGFGEMVKAVNCYGGAYIDASSCPARTNNLVQSDVTFFDWERTGTSGTHNISPLPFGYGERNTAITDEPGCTQLYAEVAGFDWWLMAQLNPSDADHDGTKFERAAGAGWPTGYGERNPLVTSQFSKPEAENSLQTYNANNVLVPIRLFGRIATGNFERLGDINDIRWTNIKHRNFAEIIDDGTDKWMCFPAFFKDASQVNGTASHTGQIGYAVRYDGP